MTPTSIQDILPLVEMPSRYLGTEVHCIKKEPQEVDLRIALAFPDLYEIGSSHFGIQILYHLLNQQSNIAAERVFAPALDMEAQLRLHGLDLFSLESQDAIRNFDLIGFSLLYEMTYTNVLNMLDLGKIPLLSAERNLSYPLVIAGGPCTSNPEPMAEVFDAMVIGDGEEVLPAMCNVWLQWRQDENRTKEALLERWSDIHGVYIPSFFEPVDRDSALSYRLVAKKGKAESIKRAIVADLNHTFFPKTPLVPFGKPVHDRLRLEVARGCSRGCRFCQAGMIYRPVRERQPTHLALLAKDAIAATGYEDLSLLSLSTGDYGCIDELMQILMQTCEKEHVAISLPSLRAGTLSPTLMEQIKRVRKTGFTIAPEAGSQRLRNVINKNITEEDIIQTVQNAFSMGWTIIKLYFMVGLPTETQEDIDAIVELVQKLKRLKGPKGKRKKINVSVATFIPKGHTPFQWAPQISPLRAKEIIDYLKEKLNGGGVQLKWQNPQVSLIEGLMARGDRRTLRSIMEAYHLGCKFDGWNDHFDFEKWQQAFESAGIDMDDFIDRPLNHDTFLPWDHVDIGVDKRFLLQEWEKAEKSYTTQDCRFQKCEACGVCNFESLAPIVHKSKDVQMEELENVSVNHPQIYHKFHVTYHKTETARLLGHLEMAKVFHRAIKRAGIKVEFSKGFHPMPKVSFDNPLPLGMESQCEHLSISVSATISPQTFMQNLNQQLPKGLQLTDVRLKKISEKSSDKKKVTYQIVIKDGFFDQKRLNSFIKGKEFFLQRTTRKGKIKHIDLKSVVSLIKITAPNTLSLSLVEEPGRIVRPIEILGEIFDFNMDVARTARILKLSVFDQ